MSTASAPTPYYLPIRQDWLDQRNEPILEPDLPIVDPHHHLWDRPGWRYLLDELLADTESGHNIVATVFVQARAMTRAAGPVEACRAHPRGRRPLSGDPSHQRLGRGRLDPQSRL